jgi:hypothetical protein
MSNGELGRVEKEVIMVHLNKVCRTTVMYTLDICVFTYSRFYFSATRSINVLFLPQQKPPHMCSFQTHEQE